MTDPGTAAPPGLAPGEAVRVRFTKWGGGPHWSAEVLWLGADAHGAWLGDPRGNHWSRPDAELDSLTDNVLLVPQGRGFAAIFYEQHPEQRYRVYTDITTEPRWHGATLTAVDLDLDVIQCFDGSTFVADEDEFAEHQVRYGYPKEVVEAARAECARVVAELEGCAPQFEEAEAARWRAMLARLTERPGVS